MSFCILHTKFEITQNSVFQVIVVALILDLPEKKQIMQNLAHKKQRESMKLHSKPIRHDSFVLQSPRLE